MPTRAERRKANLFHRLLGGAGVNDTTLHTRSETLVMRRFSGTEAAPFKVTITEQ